MVTPLGIDTDALLAPIDGPTPAGIDLRSDFSANSLYFRLRDARTEARDSERQADASDDREAAPPQQWQTVQSLAAEALSARSKDLEIAGWLTEALVRSAGLAGFATGADILLGLVDRYWDVLYPLPDEDGMETRVAPLAGLSGQGVDGTLMQPLRKLVLFHRADGPFRYWQYEQTLELARIPEAQRRQRLEAGVTSYDAFETDARAAGAAHWTALRQHIAHAAASWAALGEGLDRQAESASPSTSRVRNLLADMQDVAARFSPAEESAAAPAPDVAAPAGTLATATAIVPGVITGRDQAISQLSDIAAWFKRNEPNSPLAYTLEEAARRARLSLPELLEELMPDETGRNALLISLGIRPRTDTGGG